MLEIRIKLGRFLKWQFKIISTQKRALSFLNIFFKLQVIKVVNNERLIFCVITEIKHDSPEKMADSSSKGVMWQAKF